MTTTVAALKHRAVLFQDFNMLGRYEGRAVWVHYLLLRSDQSNGDQHGSEAVPSEWEASIACSGTDVSSMEDPYDTSTSRRLTRWCRCVVPDPQPAMGCEPEMIAMWRVWCEDNRVLGGGSNEASRMWFHALKYSTLLITRDCGVYSPVLWSLKTEMTWSLGWCVVLKEAE